ncbi:hypothetical protein [Streptomyces sp. MUM 178J]|uniref:hypothetical protein n=1 Tax=Streptomyces sp. MUM 178J TaxID=2791991 RepID=UPI002E7AD6E5|nr:hypothetical protein [Streptomyces sp. MUM 178J]WRQ82850.1 hypothetical protein I3F59_027840 [Streptomyces sp. MUM 178J]
MTSVTSAGRKAGRLMSSSTTDHWAEACSAARDESGYTGPDVPFTPDGVGRALTKCGGRSIALPSNRFRQAATKSFDGATVSVTILMVGSL